MERLPCITSDPLHKVEIGPFGEVTSYTYTRWQWPLSGRDLLNLIRSGGFSVGGKVAGLAGLMMAFPSSRSRGGTLYVEGRVEKPGNEWVPVFLSSQFGAVSQVSL